VVSSTLTTGFIVQQYPSFDAKHRSGVYYFFDKLDGSNVRAEWSRKRAKKEPETFGFYKFGKRHGLLDGLTQHLEKAKPLILEKYAALLCEIFMQKRLTKATAFFEFHGPSSNFGWHADEEHTVTLIDVHIYKQGFMDPGDFVDWFQYIDHAPVLHHGYLSEVIERIKDGTLPGMTYEGVVGKGKPGSTGKINMFKVKSEAWYAELRSRCASAGDPDAAFRRLS